MSSKPEIIVIVAVADNNAIGYKGDIPWRIKEDFQHFQKLTMGHPCVMGDVTYMSLPENARPLPGRENVVLTFNREFKAPRTTIFFSWEDAMEYLKDKEKVFICGGASIYKLGLKFADTFELTRVHQSPEADTFFPEVDWKEWNLVKEEKHKGYSFLTYKRVKT